jgi:hypothetical protein
VKELMNRLTETWTPACWFGFFTEALPEGDGYPAHFLVACWQPHISPPLPQLPHSAAIISRSSVHAAAELLRMVPQGVPIVLLKKEHVNIALIADMILTADRNLSAHYREGIQRFIEEDRKQWRLKIETSYSDIDDSFEKFKSKLLSRGSSDQGDGATQT